MPLLDVSEVFTDPMLIDTFQVIRRLQVVNQYGEVTPGKQTVNATGVIQAAGDNSLIRQEDFQAQAKTIDVYTQFRLRGVAETIGKTQYQPDIIVWHGDNFLVRSVEDFSGFGQGFVHAEASSIDFVDQPPPEQGS